MTHKSGFRSLTFFVIFAFTLSLCSTAFYTAPAQAAETLPVYIGEAMADADAKVFVVSGSGESIKMDSYPMPLFDDSLIVAKEGGALLLLAPDGLVEVMQGSEVKIDRYGERNFVSINSGAIKFAVPSKDVFAIAIPSEGISITLASSLASTSDKLPVDSGERAGFVELSEDGTVIVSSSKGSLEVSSVEGDTMVLAQGKSVQIARNGGGSTTRAAVEAIKNYDMLMVMTSALLAVGVAVFANTTSSGAGWVASSP